MAIIAGETYLQMTPEYWELIKSTTLISKTTFEESMYNFIFKDQGVQVMGIVLTFPNSLTTKERHTIHIFSEKNNLEAISKGAPPNRCIDVCFSEKYIQKIYNNYYKEPVIVPETNSNQEQMELFINKFKKAILDDLMNVIDKHLQELYLKHYM